MYHGVKKARGRYVKRGVDAMIVVSILVETLETGIIFAKTIDDGARVFRVC